MRKKALALSGSALFLGIAGFFLRFLELRYDYTDRALPIPGSPLRIVTPVFLLAAAVVLAVCVAVAGKERRDLITLNTGERFSSAVYTVLTVLCGLGLTACAVYYYLTTDHTVFDGLFALFLAMTGISQLVLTLARPEKGSDPVRVLFGAICPVFGCLWLITLYRIYAGHPTLTFYCYQFLAIVASTLTYYYMMGFYSSRGRCRRSLFAALLGTVLCLLSVADSAGIHRYLYLLHAIVNLCAVWRLLVTPVPPEPEEQAPEGTVPEDT